MEDLLMIAALVLYFVVMSVTQKNKKKKTKKVPSLRQIQFEQAFGQGNQESVCTENFRSIPAYEMPEKEEMRHSGEGEDPCHPAREADALKEDSPVYCSPIFDAEDRDAFSRDVVRGIVMSEVLAKPSQRRKYNGMGRRT